MHRLSGTALYVAAVLRTLAVYKPHPFRLTVDGETHEFRAWLVAVGNGPAYGGGMNIAPNATLDDGLLDVTVVGAMTRLQMLTNFPKVFKGTHVGAPDGHARSAARASSSSRSTRRCRWTSTPTANASARCPRRWKRCRDALTVRVP